MWIQPCQRYKRFTSNHNWYRDLAHTSPNFHRGGSKSAKFGVVFNIIQFENAARYLNSQTKFLCRNDRYMPLPSLAKLGLRTPENLLAVVPQPLKLHGENDKLITLRPNC